ncbi:hypothetical protein FF011L_13850 [Roseimaritima multifibrata]|uniref:Uncharacterized protein n=1 Tax=Roseimaritima multifibrata TaxID=1930274 RepID=A0A517MCM1_9BACT|nr:hypothetical protein [Roseimaritima multifibrata]QDS92638.1 hypothetical protein FF011L_13850 [Roseimaritima multifibrata]
MNQMILLYLLMSLLVVSASTMAGTSRRFRLAVLIPLSLAIVTVGWLFGFGAKQDLPGLGAPAAWGWFPLIAAWVWSTLANPSRWVFPVSILLAWFTLFGFMAVNEPLSVRFLLTTLHHTLIAALAALAWLGFAQLVRLGAGGLDVENRFPANLGFLVRLSAGLVIGLLTVLAGLFLVPGKPLQLQLPLAMVVAAAEMLAAFCVWRGFGELARSGFPQTSKAKWANGPVLLAVFVIAGFSFAWIPIILTGATRLGQ